MVRECAASGCSVKYKKGQHLSLKYFPKKDKRRRKIWIDRVKLPGWTPDKNSVLCELHFDNDQWETGKEDGKRKLKKTAVPTLFHVPLPNHSIYIDHPYCQIGLRKIFGLGSEGKSHKSKRIIKSPIKCERANNTNKKKRGKLPEFEHVDINEGEHSVFTPEFIGLDEEKTNDDASLKLDAVFTPEFIGVKEEKTDEDVSSRLDAEDIQCTPDICMWPETEEPDPIEIVDCCDKEINLFENEPCNDPLAISPDDMRQMTGVIPGFPHSKKFLFVQKGTKLWPAYMPRITAGEPRSVDAGTEPRIKVISPQRLRMPTPSSDHSGLEPKPASAISNRKKVNIVLPYAVKNPSLKDTPSSALPSPPKLTIIPDSGLSKSSETSSVPTSLGQSPLNSPKLTMTRCFKEIPNLTTALEDDTRKTFIKNVKTTPRSLTPFSSLISKLKIKSLQKLEEAPSFSKVSDLANHNSAVTTITPSSVKLNSANTASLPKLQESPIASKLPALNGKNKADNIIRSSGFKTILPKLQESPIVCKVSDLIEYSNAHSNQPSSFVKLGTLIPIKLPPSSITSQHTLISKIISLKGRKKIIKIFPNNCRVGQLKGGLKNKNIVYLKKRIFTLDVGKQKSFLKSMNRCAQLEDISLEHCYASKLSWEPYSLKGLNLKEKSLHSYCGKKLLTLEESCGRNESDNSTLKVGSINKVGTIEDISDAKQSELKSPRPSTSLPPVKKTPLLLKLYQCHLCKFSFLTSASLHIHSYTHVNPKLSDKKNECSDTDTASTISADESECRQLTPEEIQLEVKTNNTLGFPNCRTIPNFSKSGSKKQLQRKLTAEECNESVSSELEHKLSNKKKENSTCLDKKPANSSQNPSEKRYSLRRSKNSSLGIKHNILNRRRSRRFIVKNINSQKDQMQEGSKGKCALKNTLVVTLARGVSEKLNKKQKTCESESHVATKVRKHNPATKDKQKKDCSYTKSTVVTRKESKIKAESNPRQKNKSTNSSRGCKKCLVCGMEVERGLLKHHMMQHIEKAHVRSYNCSKCDKKFTKSYQLRKHVSVDHKTNTVTKIFKCPKKYCDRAFDSKRMLNKHTVISHSK